MSPSDRVPAPRPRSLGTPGGRRFEFDRDTVAFPNELVWRYEFDPSTQVRRISRQDPAPTYAHRCFILARAVHLFFHHARFCPDRPPLPAPDLDRRLRAVLARDPRRRCPDSDRIEIHGWQGLRDFSRDHEVRLKQAGGGAWRSYVVRSHWRMVFPISRAHQAHTAQHLASSLQKADTRIIHIVRFPSLTINHALVLYDAQPAPEGWDFIAYDPNRTDGPVVVRYTHAHRTFTLSANEYWPGGRIDVIAIFQNWFL
ncbi:MAG: hypothetical protein JNK85_10280 [Verrucomicrobiales bacterium]|nr:hypothetical protein [Verrucomicrobiales bacterium]